MRSMILDIKIIITVLFIAAGCVLAASEDVKVDAHELISQAAAVFSQANEVTGADADALYLKAAGLYQQAADKGNIRNAKLYYNIGNCYLLNGDLGRAIYNYKSALRLDSSDPLIQRNLDVARSKRLDKVEVKIETKVLARLCFWHYDFSLAGRFYAAVILFAALALFLTLKIWIPRMPGALPVGIIGGILFVSLAASVVVETLHNKTHHQGVIIAGEAVARTGDSEKYEPSFKEPLHSGTEFDLLEKRPQWLKVRLVDGSQVWLSEEACLLL